MRRKDLAIYGLSFLVLLGAIALWWQGIAADKGSIDIDYEPVTKDITTEVTEEKPKEIYVHVAGAVESPGVYTMEEGQRVFHAVEKAVPSKDAELDAMNLASALFDSQRIYVPKKGEAPEGFQGDGAPSLVNINTAGSQELQSLPGIGPVLADSIITYREEHGRFKEIEDLMNISGIGPKSFQKFRSKITVGQ